MKSALKIVLPALVVALAAGVAFMLVKTRPKAERKQPVKTALLVDTVALQSVNRRVQLTAMGTVVAERTVTVQPEISGLLRHEGQDFEEGGRLAKGDVIARIDDRDYKLAVAQRKADVTRAEFEVKLERGRASVAEREWTLLDKQVKTTSLGRSLALRKPHLEAANARVLAARSALEQANLRVERAVVRAPFAALVRSKRAAVGQLVGPQTPLATLVATDRFLVQVSVPVEQLSWVAVPGLNAEVGAPVRVVQQVGGHDAASRKGRVLRILGDLDPMGRMARLMVAIDDPLGVADPDPLAANTDVPMPLLLGAYVRVTIEGRELGDVFEIPRAALREGGEVWLADEADKLAVRKVQVIWREPETLMVRGKLQAGHRLVVSPIPAPVPGMALRVRAPEPDRTARAAAVEEVGK